MSVSEFFSNDYVSARSKFLSACQSGGIEVDSYLNPNAKGKGGEELTVDVARIGNPDADNVIFILSAVHGVEGYCGSGVQVGLLNSEQLENIPDNLSVVLVHGVNPYGFSHDRRVTEENVDLNRNFFDFSKAVPKNVAYENLHQYMYPENWEGPAKQSAEESIERHIEKKGIVQYQKDAMGGQYQFDDGIFLVVMRLLGLVRI